ncbi:MAG: translocation/assembly module TamB domain-containing protein, partial [Aestuariivirga sp.]
TAVKLAGPDLSLYADADVTLGSGEARYAVSRLAGKLRGIPFSASAPLVLQQAGETVTLEPARLAIGKGSIRVGGRLLPDLKATVTVQSLPLAAFAGLGGQPGLQGTLSGEAVLTGSLSAPEGSFKLSGAGLSTETLKQLGVRPMSASANGTISGGTLRAALKADAGKQLSVTGNGTVDLRTSRIDMELKGRTGPALFADRLARSGVRAQGDVGFDLRLSGALDRPDINGQITLRKGVLGDAAGRFTLRDAAGSADVSNRVVRITSLSGVTGRNGRATVTGTIALDAGLTASLDARVENGMYTDGSFVTARYDARLKITGPLLRSPLATGEIDLRGTKITLSELPKRALTPDDVKHINASRAVALQAREIRRNRPTESSSLRVDVRLRALDEVSVSGRGLNVILNGGLRIYGPLDNLAADGSFQMVRGRLTLPARSLDFERGSLTFDRDLDPKIDFVAVSRRKDATITLTVSGYASEPSIQVTSVPQMPQEEAMARLIFDNSMLELSPLQIAQIASYVATLSGGGDSGLLSGLQNALGLDQLSITENESGGTDVGIAKRLNDKLSIGVEQTTQSNTTRVIIDLSATPELKVRGSIDSEGSSRIGVYYEKDY